MNNIMLGNISEVEIDSREIAELTGKRHDSVLRDIDNILSKLGGLHTFGETYINDQNKQSYRCYKLPKRETLILVSGYSVELRAKIIDRLEYLEQQNKPALPSYAETLRLYAGEIEKNEALQLEAKENAPKVEFFDTVAKSDKWLTFKEVANILNIPELGRNNLTKKLRELKYITEFNKPYQKYVNQKLMKVIESTKGERVYTSTVVSQKGLDKFIKIFKKPVFLNGGIVKCPKPKTVIQDMKTYLKDDKLTKKQIKLKI